MTARIRVPSCCEANRKHGFIRAVEAIDGDTGKVDPNGEFGEKWEKTLVDARGVSHTFSGKDDAAKRCPACGAYVFGTELVDLESAPANDANALAYKLADDAIVDLALGRKS